MWANLPVPSYHLTVASLETGKNSLRYPALRLGNRTSCPLNPGPAPFQRRFFRRRAAAPTAVPGTIRIQTLPLAALLHVQ